MRIGPTTTQAASGNSSSSKFTSASVFQRLREFKEHTLSNWIFVLLQDNARQFAIVANARVHLNRKSESWRQLCASETRSGGLLPASHRRIPGSSPAARYSRHG